MWTAASSLTVCKAGNGLLTPVASDIVVDKAPSLKLAAKHC